MLLLQGGIDGALNCLTLVCSLTQAYCTYPQEEVEAEVHASGEKEMTEKKMDEEVKKVKMKQEDIELIKEEGEDETVGAQASKKDGSVNEDDELQKQGSP